MTINKPILHGRGYKFVWGIAALGTSLISGVFGALLPIFYQDYLGLSARWIAVASIVYAIWNAFNDPLFGYVTDNTRSKMGQTHPLYAFHGSLSGFNLYPGLVCATSGRSNSHILVDAGQYASV